MFADLHTHSTFSDGKYTPTELVDAAAKAQISFLAITDHDSWNGVAEAIQRAEQVQTVAIIPGIELGTQYNGKSVHILAYYIDMHNDALYSKMNEMRHAREIRLYKILEKLHELGYEITVEACDPKNRAVGRPHVAKALVSKGYFSTVQEVFDKLLKEGGPAYVPQPKLAPDEAIMLIHAAGGIAVLAHPSELNNADLVQELLYKFDFDGIEVYHPSSNKVDEILWKKLACQYGLLISGGSDFHGMPDRFPDKLGIFNIQQELLSGIIKYKD